MRLIAGVLLAVLVGGCAAPGQVQGQALYDAPARRALPVDAREAAERVREVTRGIASWYGAKFQGRRTASGEPFDMHDFTAAHRSLPFGTIVEVRSLVNDRTVQVRINDRGPHIKGRLIDLSRAAARELGLLGRGQKAVEVRVVAGASEVSNPGAPGESVQRGTSLE